MKDIAAGWPKRTANHFLKSFEDAATRSDEFLNRVILPSLYGADAYVPVAIDKATKGRHAGFAELLADGQAPWDNVSLFANQLANGDERPLERVIFGDRVVFTFESDTVPLADQVEWTRSRKRPEKSPLDQLFASLSRFADFEGITACWSGNKSVHIHIVFGTDHAKVRGIGAQHAREGIVAHWERLCADITPLFGFGPSARFDPAIRFPESYRRRPNGIRPDNGNRQVTLWERFRSIASADATALFWQADAFKPAAPIRVVRQARTAGAVVPIIEAPAIKARLDDMFTDWPRCHSVVSDGQGGWRALFANGPTDHNPSSFMGMRSRGVTINGGGFTGDQDALPRLPLPLADMIDVWSADSEVVEVERSPLEQAFADRVTDTASAAVAMAEVFRATVAEHPRSIVTGPEGVGKSTVLFQLHAELAEGKPSLYAFTSYGEAEAKCEAFNAANPGTGYAGVVLPSFSRAYKAACEQLDLPVYTSADAARMGYASHLAAIVGRQPAVMDALASLYTGLWETIGDRVPVFFTVHDVAHGWARGGLTRAMASHRYWFLPQAGRIRAASDINLGLMVHDECRADTFVRQVPKAVLDFIETLRAGHKGWDNGAGDLADLHAAWSAENGRRIEDECGAGFDALLTLNRSSLLLWQHLTTVADPGCYPSGRGGKTVYRDETVGREWAFLPQDWWKGAADRVVMLTTEELPIAVARKADPTWHVVNLEAPKARCDTIDVTTREDCTGRRLKGLIAGWREDRAGEEWAVVSNRAATLDDTMSHLAARGSNAFVGRNVLQTMTFLTPVEYARLAALGEWCGEGGRLIWLRHVDELNQSAGRNLGFRGREGARHALLAHPTLFALLAASGALESCRYGIALTSSREGRRNGWKAIARWSEGACEGEGGVESEREGQPPCG